MALLTWNKRNGSNTSVEIKKLKEQIQNAKISKDQHKRDKAAELKLNLRKVYKRNLLSIKM